MNIYRGRSHTEVYLASILYDSIEDQNFSSVKKLLIEKQADPNIILPRKGISSFHLAIGSDSAKFAMETTLLLIQCGGDPNVLSDEGLTPVHISAAWGRVDILKLLLSCGGDPEITDNYYKNALQYAIDEDCDEAATLIKEFINIQRLAIYNSSTCEIPYTIILDKVLLNTGMLVGEYNVSTIENDTKPQMDLNSLPETNTREYVLNWCNSQKLESTDLIDTCNIELSECCYNATSLESKNNSQSSEPFSKINYKNEITSNNCNKCLQLETKNKIQKASNITFRNRNCNYRNHVSKDICKYKESSRESGILTVGDSSEEECHYSNDIETKNCSCSKTFGDTENYNIKENKDTSSDYWTCTDGSESTNVLDKTIYDFSTNTSEKLNCNNVSDQDMVSVSEIYKYTDENIVLYEKRTLVPSTKGSQNGSLAASSSFSSLPKSFTYDTDSLRNELTMHGFNPGPITKTTKRVYLKKLYQLKKHPNTSQIPSINNEIAYSPELQRTFKDVNWYQNLAEYQCLEDLLGKQFTNPNPTRKWREGTSKTSFTYLLLDPRMTQNLPLRCEQMKKGEIWKTFLSAIFYVGKGKRSRPYAHFYTAVADYKACELKKDSKKINKILDIWKENYGVVCLHIFQNVIPVEAYTREAAMISALKLDNITNKKVGDFYGVAATWSQKEKRLLGVYLLYRAMKIFLNEGERQLFPNDIE